VLVPYGTGPSGVLAVVAWPRLLTVLRSVAARAPRRVLSRPLIAGDGRVVACSGKDLLKFQGNGSLAWVAPLGLRCNDTISPVSDGHKASLPIVLLEALHFLSP